MDHNFLSAAQRNAILIRTHFVDDNLLGFAAQLAAGGSHDVIFAVDSASGITVVPGYRTLPLSRQAYQHLGLYADDPELFWKCGDYVLYAARQQFPDYQYFWMVEYDVLINRDDPAGFFQQIDQQSDSSFVASYIKPAGIEWGWHKTMARQYQQVYRCFFPLLRVSAEAVDCLYLQRRNASAEPVQDVKDWPNDEAFCATTLQNRGFSCADFNEFGRFYTEAGFSFGELIHPSQVPQHDGLLYHSVRRGSQYLRAARNYKPKDLNLLVALTGNEWSEAEAADALAHALHRELGDLGDNPARVLGNGTIAGKLLHGNAAPWVLQVITREFAKRRMGDCLDALRNLVTGKAIAVPENLQNVALAKPAWQSSVCASSAVRDPRLDAEGGNNGASSVDFGFHTGLEAAPWWTVDLRQPYALTQLVIHNRRTHKDRLKGFLVKTSHDGTNWETTYRSSHDEHLAEPVRLDFAEPLRGRYLRIELPSQGILHFAELQAFGTVLTASSRRRAPAPVPSPPQPALGYRAWNAIRNVGDAITPYLIELITGAAPYYAPDSQEHLLGVGSILFMANRNSHVWGSGAMVPTLKDLHGTSFHAVRGLKTADALTRSGITLGHIAFGDPGIFADELLSFYGAAPSAPGKPIAVVPHHSAQYHPFFLSLRGAKDVCLVDVCDDSLLPIQQIAAAELVISQSLHGLIFAESLGKPAVWIGDNHELACYKYNDWFSMMENPLSPPAPIGTPLDALLGRAQRQLSRIDKNALRAAFPYAPLVEQRHQPLTGFRTCRAYAPLLLHINPQGQAPGPFAFFTQARQRAAELLRDWSEYPYVLALAEGAGLIPAPAQGERMMLEMDRMHRIDFAAIVPLSTLHAAGLTPLKLSDGVFMCRDIPAETPWLRHPAGVLVRPMYERPIESFTVFAV